MVLTIGPTHSLRDAARMMSARHVGAAVVIDPDHAGVGILTERDVLDSIGAGQDPDAELAAHHCTSDLVFAAPAWTLEKAAAAMVRGGFRHLVVVEGAEVTGLLSMRDIVRCWSGSTVPAPGGGAASEGRRPARKWRARHGNGRVSGRCCPAPFPAPRGLQLICTHRQPVIGKSGGHDISPGRLAGRGRGPGAGGPGDAGMRAALEKLPPGHPSSARNADGTRRPPPPRLQDLELPLPGTWADTADGGNDAATREPPAL